MSRARIRQRRLAGATVAALVVGLMAVAQPPPGAADGYESPGNPVAFRSLTAGHQHTCSLRPGGVVKCWGAGSTLGQGRLPGDAQGDEPGEMGSRLRSINLGAGRTATALTAGLYHTCALLDGGDVKCWGSNAEGELGLGDTLTRGDRSGEMGDRLPVVDLGTGRTATAISAGDTHTCAVLDDGTVKCWGSNWFGQLGLGDTANRGDGPGEMGDNLPTVDLGTGRTATMVAAGGYYQSYLWDGPNHTCAVLDTGAVKCWGNNGSGQLGIGDTANRGDGPGEMGDNLPTVDLGTGRTVLALSAGVTTNCAVLDDRTLKCWGDNGTGRLGLGDTANRGDGPGEMGDNLPTVDLGTGRTAAGVTLGRGHVCALLDQGSVKCWGSAGSLGQGDFGVRGDAPGEMGDDLPAVDLGTGRHATAITAGLHSCALLDDATVKCWGNNTSGQLGLGDEESRGNAPGQMGDDLPAVDLVAAPAMTVEIRALQTHVSVGEPIDYRLTVYNTGNEALTDITVTISDAAACQVPVGDLAVDQGNTGAGCSHSTTAGDAGTFHNRVTVEAPGAAPAVSNQVSVAVLGGGGHGAIVGEASDSVSGDGIARAIVAVLAPADFSLVAGPTTGDGGTFAVAAPPGTYFVYVLDPAGDHAPAFVGAPSTVTVVAGTTTAAAAPLTPTTGAISGDVRQSSGTGLFITLDASTGRPGRGAVVNSPIGSYPYGGFRVRDVPAGNHLGAFIDLNGRYTTEFHANRPGPNGATVIPVTGGADTGDIQAILDLQNGSFGHAHLTGTVTSSVNGASLVGVAVMAVRSSDHRLVEGDRTDSFGRYDIEVDDGSYKLAFYDLTAAHPFTWHPGVGHADLAAATTVAATASTPAQVDAALQPSTATIDGVVTVAGSGSPLAGAWVVAIATNGAVKGITTTDGVGRYQLAGLPFDTYRVRFLDPHRAHADEYFDDAVDYATADTVTLTGANSTATLDADLEAW